VPTLNHALLCYKKVRYRWGTDEDFSLTAGDLGLALSSLALSNIVFMLGEDLRPFGSDVSRVIRALYQGR
jgi:hypothetical protein